MKRFLFTVLLFFLLSTNVFAKDTAYFMNKYQEEKWTFMEESIGEDGSNDGMIVAGQILEEEIEEEDNTYLDYQIYIAKYKMNGTLDWTYSYGNTSEDAIDALSYTYDESGNINGYLIVTNKTYDVLTEPMGSNYSVLLLLDLEGTPVQEIEILEGTIQKILPTEEENQINGYISIMNTQTGSSLVKYNTLFEIVWKKDFPETALKDLTFLKENNQIIGYVVMNESQVIQLDSDGNNEQVMLNIENYPATYLGESVSGFFLYGVTSEVKLKKGDSSYFIIQFTKEGQQWEIIGSTPVDSSDSMKLHSDLLLYKNDSDSSYEVIQFDEEGSITKKVKKIKNDYYEFEDFISQKDTLYFIGQINCPEDDNCDTNRKSLFLISDEDKVIEVEDKDSTNIIIGFLIMVVLLGTAIIVKKKKRLV